MEYGGSAASDRRLGASADRRRPVLVQSPVPSQFQCASCRLVLQDPCQMACGHRACRPCLDDRIGQRGQFVCPLKEPECGPIKDYFPDYACDREMRALAVYCPYKENGCPEKMPWGKLSVHARTCVHGDCAASGQVSQPREEAVERQVGCPYEHVGCKQRGTPGEMNRHEEQATACHLQQVSVQYRTYYRCMDERIRQLEKDKRHERMARPETTKPVESDRPPDLQADVLVGNMQKPEAGPSAGRGADAAGGADPNTALGSTAAENSPGRGNVDGCKARRRKRQPSETRVSRKRHNSGFGSRTMPINDCKERKKEGACVESRPFYTREDGYKLCARVYLNGDGAGRDAYVSVSIGVMPGDNDKSLSWPYHGSVKVTLRDQEGGSKHRHEIFRPDPNRSSSRQPPQQMCEVCSIQQFVLQEIAEKLPYMINNCLLLHIEVQEPRKTVSLEE